MKFASLSVLAIRLAGEHGIAAGRVPRRRVRHRADQGDPIHELGGLRAGTSVNRTPGSAVAIVSNSPRISAGASGLGSNVSWCEAPPERNRMMQFLALPKLPDDSDALEGRSKGAADSGRPARAPQSAEARADSVRRKTSLSVPRDGSSCACLSARASALHHHHLLTILLRWDSSQAPV